MPPDVSHKLVGVCLCALALSLAGCGTTVQPPAIESLSDPVTIYLADHGIHSSLTIPRDAASPSAPPEHPNMPVSADGSPIDYGQPDGTLMVQYAFSRFDWAALDNDEWYRGPFALLVPGEGGFGRRELVMPLDDATRTAAYTSGLGTTTDDAAAASSHADRDAARMLQHFEDAGIAPNVDVVWAIQVDRARRDELLRQLDDRWARQETTRMFNQKRGFWFVRDAQNYSIGHTCNTEVSMWLEVLGCDLSGHATAAEFTVKQPSGKAIYKRQ
jgi:hypothetical protein